MFRCHPRLPPLLAILGAANVLSIWFASDRAWVSVRGASPQAVSRPFVGRRSLHRNPTRMHSETVVTAAARPTAIEGHAASSMKHRSGRQVRLWRWTGLTALFVAAAPAAAGAAAVAKPFMVHGYTSAKLFPVQGLSLLTWALLIFFPRWKKTKRLALVVPFIHACLYAALVGWAIAYPQVEALPDFSTLAGVQSIFRTPDAVFAGWLHYCVFDSLVGLGEVLDAQKNRIPHILVIPCLVLTMFLGPMGFLAYMIIRKIVRASRKPRGIKGILMA